MNVEYSIYFNRIDIPKELREKSGAVKTEKESDADGPTVERRCPSCGNDKMSYATLQLRSADEGQTVFYTCTKCKYVIKDFIFTLHTFIFKYRYIFLILFQI